MLEETIKKETIEALKGKDELKLSVLRMLSSAIKNVEINTKQRLDDAQILGVIEKQAKQRREAFAQFEQAGRQDLAEKEKNELKILENYLPEKLSRDEIKEIVQKIIDDNPEASSDLGKTMNLAMSALRGKADGKDVSEVVKELISK